MVHLITLFFVVVALLNSASAAERERIFSNGGQTINEFDTTGTLRSSTRLDRDGKLIEKREYDAHGQIIHSSHNENPILLTLHRNQQEIPQHVRSHRGGVCLIQEGSSRPLPHCTSQIEVFPAR